jgi:hypothetical protein
MPVALSGQLGPTATDSAVHCRITWRHPETFHRRSAHDAPRGAAGPADVQQGCRCPCSVCRSVRRATRRQCLRVCSIGGTGAGSLHTAALAQYVRQLRSETTGSGRRCAWTPSCRVRLLKDCSKEKDARHCGCGLVMTENEAWVLSPARSLVASSSATMLATTHSQLLAILRHGKLCRYAAA